MRAMGKKLEQAPDVGLNRAGKRCGGGAGRSRWHRAQRGNRPWRQWQVQVASGAAAVLPATGETDRWAGPICTVRF
jgi:hypothetical protein